MTRARIRTRIPSRSGVAALAETVPAQAAAPRTYRRRLATIAAGVLAAVAVLVFLVGCATARSGPVEAAGTSARPASETESAVPWPAAPTATPISDYQLLAAVAAGDTAAVAQLLAAGANVNARGADGHSALTSAIVSTRPAGNTDMVTLLLAFGADVNQVNPAHNSVPLHAAAAGNQPEIVRLLLDHGALLDVHCSWKTAGTPLHVAVSSGAVESARALLDGGADPDSQTEGGQTPLMVAIRHTRRSYARLELLDLLLERGANPNLQDVDGNTALHDAARNGMADEIQLLLAHGASLVLQNRAGQTAVDAAASDWVADLLRTGAGDA